MADEIIAKAEKLKMKRIAKAAGGEANADLMMPITLTLSDIIDGYRSVMKRHGYDQKRENHYYAMMVKLSLNQRGKTWRESLNIEKAVSQSNSFNLEKQRKADCSQLPQETHSKTLLLLLDLELHLLTENQSSIHSQQYSIKYQVC